MIKPEKLIVDKANKLRLDKYLSDKIEDISRSYIQKLIKSGNVSVNGASIDSPKEAVFTGDIIRIIWPEEKSIIIPEAEDFKFEVLFEDNDLIVINKPAGIVVHPAVGNWSGTVVNALIGKNDSFAENFQDEKDSLSTQRPGIVHRLDKDTSGCLIIAKNLYSKNKLSKSFSERDIKKTYYALVSGYPVKEKEKIVTLIGRHPVNRKKMSVVDRNGREAVTIYELIEKGNIDKAKVSLLRVNILTGRTHQIRVHLAYRKIPVLGDKVYGGHQKLTVARQMLHAGKISFPHPRSGKLINAVSQYPEDFQTIVNQL